jgi:hypothetical protein
VLKSVLANAGNGIGYKRAANRRPRRLAGGPPVKGAIADFRNRAALNALGNNHIRGFLLYWENHP